jgi:hypothetical protein
MRFLVPRRERLAVDALTRSYVVGLDDVPWPSRARYTSDGIVVQYTEEQSGRFRIPWHFGPGSWMLSTANLPPRDAPYHLTVELARGTITRLRDEINLWESQGYVLRGEMLTLLSAMQKVFARAATSQHDVLLADDLATETLSTAWDAWQMLGRQYGRVASRRREFGFPPVAIGVNLGVDLPPFSMQKDLAANFGTLQIPLNWRKIEPHEGERDWSNVDKLISFAKSQNRQIVLGPLLQIDKRSLPDWIYLWSDDESGLSTAIENFLADATSRYRGITKHWICAARMNMPGPLGLHEEQRLRFCVQAMDAIKQAEPKAEITLVLDQPWAEFLAHQNTDLPPIYFADALLRGDFGLTGIGLEINWGYTSPGSDTHHLLDFSRQLDRWSSLERPLYIWLTLPSGTGTDALAQCESQPLPMLDLSAASLETQSLLTQGVVPMLASKPRVHGIFWQQLSDHLPHDYAHGGLFDAQQQAKPTLAALHALRLKLGLS